MIGYLWGGIPTADLLARAQGIDLRTAGSGNPGTNNALRLGGRRLGLSVLTMEMAKGFIAAWISTRIAGNPAIAAASIGAVAGNVFNPYFRGRGGKGLGITAGITLGAWPTFLPFALAIAALSFVLLRRSGPATLITAASYAVGAFLWSEQEWSTGWGVRPGPALLVMGIGIAVLLVPRALSDTLHPMSTNQEGAGDSAPEN